jgi:hypothetical protein
MLTGGLYTALRECAVFSLLPCFARAPASDDLADKVSDNMSDELSLSYSMTPSPAAPDAENRQAPDQANSLLVAFADCDLIPIDGQRTLVINRQNGKQQFFAPPVVDALKTCTRFDTIAGHTRRLCTSRPELKGQEASVGGTLSQLEEQGFLLRDSDIAPRLSTDRKARLAPSRVFIITCDRPEGVERLLESMLRAGNLSQHEAIYLVDDSRGEENRSKNEDLIARFNLRSARDAYYFGPNEQQALMAALVSAVPEAERGIRFLLDPALWTGKKTYGRTRNVALLLSVGKRAVVLDDDILCEAVRPPIKEDGIELKGLRQADFFPDRDTLMARAVRADSDPVTGHLKYLGQHLGFALNEVVGGSLTRDCLLGANAAMLNELEADTPVLITQCGSWGDPGTGSAHWALGLDEGSIERLVNAPHGMGAALENRCSWFGCTRPTLHKMAFMSQMTGLDNSHLLPPYFPAFRGEDLLFASMVEAMYHHGAVLEYDWCVPHLPLDDRSDRGLREPIAGEGGIKLFTRYLVENIDYKDSSNPERRLLGMAEDARRMADRSDKDLLLDYRREQAKGEADGLYRARVRYQAAQELPSQNWQAYLSRALEECERSLGKEHTPLDIRGIGDDATEVSLLAEFRNMARGWANALQQWPAIRDAARTAKT